MNMPVPVPGSTFTDCYPSQYITSYLLSAGGVTQPAFDPLICPQHYTAVGPYTSNYIACCPSGYSFAQPTSTIFTDRPAFGGTCYTPILEATPVVVTAYGSSGVTATTTFSATVTNAQAYAYPIDGFAFGVAEVPSITSAASSTTTGSGSASSTSAAAKSVHSVLAGTDPVFVPSSVNASIGDTILFLFESGNHSVTQSTFDNPCSPLSNGFDSGYEPNIDNTVNPTPNYTISVTSTGSEWFYSKQGSECESGMVFALNPTNTQSFSTFHQNALNTNSGSSGLSAGATAGAAVGAVAGAALIFTSIFYFYRRNRKNPAPVASPEDGADNELAMIGTGGEEWPAEHKPGVPPKGAELHDQSTPGELNAVDPPSELHDESMYGTQSSPAEMWSPTSTMVSQGHEHSGFGQVSRDEQ